MLLRLHRRHRDEGGGWCSIVFLACQGALNWTTGFAQEVSSVLPFLFWGPRFHGCDLCTSRRSGKNAGIESMLNKAIELSMMYPHVERDDYCAAWPEPPGDGDQRERYDNYCCFLFNMLEGAWRLKKGRPKLVAELVPSRNTLGATVRGGAATPTRTQTATHRVPLFH